MRFDLKDAGMRNLLDLRDNPCGLMDAAREISDEFLSDGQKIVMTKDRKNEERSYYASSQGNFQDGPMAVLTTKGRHQQARSWRVRFRTTDVR